MIDVETGHLLIDSERTVTPQSSLSTIEEWQLGTSQKTRRSGNGWNWVDVKNLAIDGVYLNVSFLFHGQKMRGFTFVFQAEPYEENPGWASWSRDAENINLVRFNGWLNEKFGETREFEWGKIQASYDSKSAGSSIRLRYHT